MQRERKREIERERERERERQRERASEIKRYFRVICILLWCEYTHCIGSLRL